VKKTLILILLLGVFFILGGCKINSENKNKNGGAELIPISEEIIEQLFATRKIIIEDYITNSIKRTISDENEIEKIINIFSRTTETTGIVTSEGYTWKFTMYDIDDKLISTIYVWKSENIGLINIKEYSITLVEDYNALIEIVEN